MPERGQPVGYRHPLAENRGLYDRHYAVYKMVYPALQETFQNLG